MRHFKGVCVGAVAVALLLAPGCKSNPNNPQVDSQQGTGGAGMNTRGSDNETSRDDIGTSDSVNRGTSEGMERGTGGSGTSTGTNGLGTGSTNSQPMGNSTGTGTEGSDMGSGGATNSAQDQGTPPR